MTGPRRSTAVAALAAVFTGCAGLVPEPPTTRAPDFHPRQIRQPAVFVRVVLEGSWSAADRAALRADYEGGLLEALNARGVLVRDARSVDAREGQPRPETAVARAREIGADHAVIVDVRVAPETVRLCQDTRRPLRAQATVWHQDLHVLRAADGATRLKIVDNPTLTAHDAEIDCDTPRDSKRRTPTETIAAALEALLRRLLESEAV
ncbi:MAG TPA: hypothetical protein VFX28_09810, partial [Methylomirabilota bacterium]|nr:hypothetical protein [Methylomirabilota bacterium]